MSLRHAILGLLAASPGSGYELTKRFNHTLTQTWPTQHSHQGLSK